MSPVSVGQPHVPWPWLAHKAWDTWGIPGRREASLSQTSAARVPQSVDVSAAQSLFVVSQSKSRW